MSDVLSATDTNFHFDSQLNVVQQLMSHAAHYGMF